MSFCKRVDVTVTTASDGSATAYTEAINGLISAIGYTKTSYEDTVDFTITCEDSGLGVWAESNVTASKTIAPRMATHSTAAVAATFDGTRAVLEKIPCVDERIKIVLAQGGNAKVGAFFVITE